VAGNPPTLRYLDPSLPWEAATVQNLKASVPVGAAVVLALVGCDGGTTVPDPDPLVVALATTPVSVHGGSDGTIELTVTGGVTPYRYRWSNGETTEDIGHLSAGTYSVVVTDADGQVETGSTTVTQPDPLDVVLLPSHVSVFGASDGAIDLTVSGAVGPYSYLWSNGETTEDIGDLSPGTYSVAVAAANGQTATDSASIDQPLISASGTLAFSITPPDDNNEIYVVNADGTGLLRLTNREGRDLGPVWSPDATKIAFYAHSVDETMWSIHVMDADGGNLTRLTDVLGVHDDSPTWSPDGAQIAFARAYPDQSFRSELWVMNADGTDQRQIGSTDGGGPDWSPDGSRIAFHSDRSGDFQLYAMDPDGAGLQRLTTSGARDLWPAWSPDNAKIAFESTRDGNFEIYVVNADGTEPRRLTSNTALDVNPDWSPDGTRITFTSMRDGHWEVYVMNADGTGQRRVTYTTVHAVLSDWRPMPPAPTK